MQQSAHSARRASPVAVRTGAAVACCVAALCGGARWRTADPASAGAELRTHITRAADSLDASLVALDAALAAAHDDTTMRHRLGPPMGRARAHFKRLEGVVEFYAPGLAATLNARRQELDDDDLPPPSPTTLTGFPALEAITMHGLTKAGVDSARVVVKQMRVQSNKLRTLSPALVPSEAQVVELVRLELARVETLGIAGFDAPKSGEAMRESAEAIVGVRSTMAVMGPAYWPALDAEREAIDSMLTRAVDYLHAHPDFVRFDRLAFITGYAEPALRAVDQLRRAAGITPVRIQRVASRRPVAILEGRLRRECVRPLGHTTPHGIDRRARRNAIRRSRPLRERVAQLRELSSARTCLHGRRSNALQHRARRARHPKHPDVDQRRAPAGTVCG
jgi:hypothetical protein